MSTMAINLQSLMNWLVDGEQLPRSAYQLRPGCHVTDPDRFHEGLITEAMHGMPRCRLAGFVIDLADVHAAAVRAGTVDGEQIYSNPTKVRGPLTDRDFANVGKHYEGKSDA